MTKTEYQEVVEKKFNDSLENIMYNLCVVKKVVASEGANILDVPKEVFIYWRNKLRLGPIQRRADKAKRVNKEKLAQYKNGLQNIDFNRRFIYGDKKSLDGLREMLERKLELLKAQKIKYNPDVLEKCNFEININVMVLEQTIRCLDSYLSGELHKEIKIELQRLNAEIKSGGFNK